MAVSPHPSVKPTAPKRPPSDSGGQGSRESGQAGVPYGSSHKIRVHGHGNHKSEFAHTMEGGASGGFPKAGDRD
ncbi:MAG: hypothetical protein KGL39_43110 [Patescibacteria group bacterium]|nr:hypothetical protein [Patescibacteria group bacterium]